jgi:hypothetical protein
MFHHHHAGERWCKYALIANGDLATLCEYYTPALIRHVVSHFTSWLQLIYYPLESHYEF